MKFTKGGFTLIELLIVVVIIGILAAIAIPKFANTKQKAYIASMKSDLRNLITAEEAYFADSVKYASTTCATSPCNGVLFVPTTGNTLGAIAVTGDGWTATETNQYVSNPLVTCAVYIGSTSIPPATKEGEPKCQ